MKKQVLFLCTGNSCRSQMAESLVNHYIGDIWQASSAGVNPSGYIHPLAIQAMGELGIDISQNLSKSVDYFRDYTFDVVLTVCDNAAQNCPVWLGSGRTRHIGFDDPAHATGSLEERVGTFRRVRDEIREQILSFLQDESDQGIDFTYSL